jgi:hypothetical protein
VQRAPDVVLTGHPPRSLAPGRSDLNAVLWAAAAVATIVLALARAESFWLLAALVAGLSLSGSV